MFRRKKSQSAPEPVAQPVVVPRPGGKGQPTRTRKEAEAARRVGLGGMSPAAGSKDDRRQRRLQEYQALKGGDPNYLPDVDKGADRKMIRDYVDSRISLGELAIPVFAVLLVAGLLFKSPHVLAVMNMVLMVVIVAMVVDFFWITRRVKGLLKKHHPTRAHRRGNGWYAVRRAMQFRRMRLPRAQVKLGAKIG